MNSLSLFLSFCLALSLSQLSLFLSFFLSGALSVSLSLACFVCLLFLSSEALNLLLSSLVLLCVCVSCLLAPLSFFSLFYSFIIIIIIIISPSLLYYYYYYYYLSPFFNNNNNIIIIFGPFLFLFYFPLGLGILLPFLAPYNSINSDTCSQYKT